MTYRELLEEVVDLGFDANVGSLTGLASATNRALRHIGRFLPPVTQVILSQRAPVYELREETPVKGTLTASGSGVMGLSFSFIGEGFLRAEGDTETKERAIASPGWATCKMVFSAPQDVTLTLANTKGLAVREFALLPLVDDTECETLLPLWGEMVRYELSELCPEYLAMGGVPVTEAGAEIRGYAVDKKALYLPREVCGKIQVTVRRNPHLATLDCFKNEAEMDGAVDCPDEITDLLPLLVASYVWIDVEPEKAQHYKARFDEQYAMWRMQQKFQGKMRVVNRNGW